MGLDIPDYVTVRTRERPGQFREEIIKRLNNKVDFEILTLKVFRMQERG